MSSAPYSIFGGLPTKFHTAMDKIHENITSHMVNLAQQISVTAMTLLY